MLRRMVLGGRKKQDAGNNSIIRTKIMCTVHHTLLP
jgi:hypothetical protein